MNLPKYSQHLDVKEESWKNKSCGIVALKMIMEAYSDNTPSISSLIYQGLEADAYLEGVGWKHKELAQLAEEFGLYGKNFDWSDLTNEKAWERAKKYFPKYPIIASVYKNLDPDTGSGHLILLKSIENGKITYHEPDAKNRQNIEKTTNKQNFLTGWKKRIIIVTPHPTQ